MRRLFGFAVVSAIVLVACSSHVTEPPHVQVSTLAASACANLRTLRCPEGETLDGGDPCDVVFTRRNDLKPIPLKCWAEAESVPIARGCGLLRCTQ